MRRVQRAPGALVGSQPARELLDAEGHQLLAVVVGEETCAAAARRDQRRVRGGQDDSVGPRLGDLHGVDDRIPVGAEEAQQDERQPAGSRAGPCGVDPRRGAVLRRRLGLRVARGRLAEELRRAPAGEVRPTRHAVDPDVDGNPVGVILPQPPVPERAALPGAEIALGARSYLAVEQVAVGFQRQARVALGQDVAVLRGEAVLSGVVGEGDARVPADPLELLAEAERRGEADRPALAIAQADRRDRGDHGTAGRRHVRERRRHIAVDDLVDPVGPGGSHPAQPNLRRAVPARSSRPSGAATRSAR